MKGYNIILTCFPETRSEYLPFRELFHSTSIFVKMFSNKLSFSLEEQLNSCRNMDKGAEKHKKKFRIGSVLSICLAIALIAVGALKVHNCQVEPMIPIFLIGRKNFYF